jgi:hypothetical protein
MRRNGAGFALAWVALADRDEPAFRCTDVCEPVPVDVPAQGSTVDLVMYTTGLASARADEVEVRIAGKRVETVAILPWIVPGLDVLRVRLHDDFRLRGYLPLTARAGSLQSNTVYLWLR